MQIEKGPYGNDEDYEQIQAYGSLFSIAMNVSYNQINY